MQGTKNNNAGNTRMTTAELAAVFARGIRANYAPGDWQFECRRMIEELVVMSDARRADVAVAHSQSRANLARKDAMVLEALAEGLKHHLSKNAE